MVNYIVHLTSLATILLSCSHFRNSEVVAYDGCHPHTSFGDEKIVTPPANKSLSKVSVQCPQKVVFEIRYINGSLCVCGRTPDRRSKSFNCGSILSMDVKVKASFRNTRISRNIICTFTMRFLGLGSRAKVITLSLKLSPGGLVLGNSTVVSSEETLVKSSTLAITAPVAQSSLLSSIVVSSIHSTITSSIEPTMLVGVVTLLGYPSSDVVSKTLLSSPLSTVAASFYTTSISTSAFSTHPLLIASSSLDPPSSKLTSIIQASPTTISPSSSSTMSTADRLKQDVQFIDNLNTSAVDINDKKTIARVLEAASNLINSNLTSGNDENEDPGMMAVRVLQALGKLLSRQLILGSQSSVIFQATAKDLVFGVAVINTATMSSAFSFPSFGNNAEIGDEKIEIPSSAFVSSTGKAFFVGIIFNGAREMRNKTGDDGFILGTKAISAEIFPLPPAILEDDLKTTFEKSWDGSSFKEDCSFWLDNSSLVGEHGRWSTRQCRQMSQDKTHIKCACDHFTTFAVLFKVTGRQKTSEEDTFRLVLITYIGLGLSIVGCLLTFVIYVTLRNIKSDRAAIHTNLVFALGLADAIFLIAVTVKPAGNTCLAIAILAFFFYLAVFFWMLVEGVYIYLMVIKVFRGNMVRRRRIAYLVGWGCPLIIAGVTWAILRDDVVSKYHCWLSVTSGAIWAFVGPALFIILVNIVILSVVMRTTWATFVDDKEYGGLKSATKTFGAVVPILGITWVFGVMAFNESLVVFQYIFAITNSIQGIVIFILYCVVNNEVRNEIQRKITVWKTRRDVTSSSGARRPTYVITSEKNTTFNRTTQSGGLGSSPDLHPLSEIGDLSLHVENNYSFDNIQMDEEPKKNGCLENGSKEKLAASGNPEKGDVGTDDVEPDSGRSSPSGDQKSLEYEHESSVGYV